MNRLYAAIRANKPEDVRELLDNGCDIYQRCTDSTHPSRAWDDRLFTTPLELSHACGNEEIRRLVREKHAHYLAIDDEINQRIPAHRVAQKPAPLAVEVQVVCLVIIVIFVIAVANLL